MHVYYYALIEHHGFSVSHLMYCYGHYLVSSSTLALAFKRGETEAQNGRMIFKGSQSYLANKLKHWLGKPRSVDLSSTLRKPLLWRVWEGGVL